MAPSAQAALAFSESFKIERRGLLLRASAVCFRDAKPTVARQLKPGQTWALHVREPRTALPPLGVQHDVTIWGVLRSAPISERRS